MKWVTREHTKTDRIACPWLIRMFIDPDAEIVYVPADQVLSFAERESATSFDAKGARYTHRDSLCSFEVLIEDYKLGADPALALMAQVVHGADVSDDRDATPQSPGLLAIADGFALLGVDDQRQLEQLGRAGARFDITSARELRHRDRLRDHHLLEHLPVGQEVRLDRLHVLGRLSRDSRFATRLPNGDDVLLQADEHDRELRVCRRSRTPGRTAGIGNAGCLQVEEDGGGRRVDLRRVFRLYRRFERLPGHGLDVGVGIAEAQRHLVVGRAGSRREASGIDCRDGCRRSRARHRSSGPGRAGSGNKEHGRQHQGGRLAASARSVPEVGVDSTVHGLSLQLDIVSAAQVRQPRGGRGFPQPCLPDAPRVAVLSRP